MNQSISTILWKQLEGYGNNICWPMYH